LLAVVTGYYFVFYITFGLISVSCFLTFLSKELRTIGKATGIASTSTPSLGDSLKNLIQWELIVICVISFTRMFVMNGVMSTGFPLYLHETLGFDVSIIGIITAVRTGGFTTATILSGYMSDRIGRKKTILLSLVIEAFSIYGYTVVDSLGFIIPLGIIDGLEAGLVSVTLTVLLSYIVKSEFRGISIGLFRTFMDVGGIVGSIFFMALAEGLNTRTSFLGGTIMLLVMALLLLTIKQERKM